MEAKLDVDLDVQQIERASEGIDALIESRALANREARREAESLERYDLRHAAGHRAEWAAFYRTQIQAAEGMRERAAERLARLIDEGV